MAGIEEAVEELQEVKFPAVVDAYMHLMYVKVG